VIIHKEAEAWPTTRAKVLRDGVGIGVATGTYGLSFGALATTAGLSTAQTCALSLLMFTGASQFAMVGVIASGGHPIAGAATASLLGTRNAFYGLRLWTVLGLRGRAKAGAAHFVIDESAAMAMNRESVRAERLGFWSAGLSVFVFWNIATLLGALGAQLLSDPRVFGLDVVAPAAFVALLAPRMRAREPWAVALMAGVVTLMTVPLLPPGMPVLVVAVITTIAGAYLARGEHGAPKEHEEPKRRSGQRREKMKRTS
jgi:predicted branched-subunit amino acid permease